MVKSRIISVTNGFSPPPKLLLLPVVLTAIKRLINYFDHLNLEFPGTNNFIKSMPQKLRRRLCEELDHKTGLGKDWSLVAEYLEMEPNVIKKIEEFPEKMSHVLQHMEHSMKNIQDLVDILEKMGRMDCIYIMMEEGVDGISPGIYTCNSLKC